MVQPHSALFIRPYGRGTVTARGEGGKRMSGSGARGLRIGVRERQCGAVCTIKAAGRWIRLFRNRGPLIAAGGHRQRNPPWARGAFMFDKREAQL